MCVCVCVCAQSCLTLCNLLDCSPPGSSVHGILQARILEQVAISFSRGSSWPKDQTCISFIGIPILYPLIHQGSPFMFRNSKFPLLELPLLNSCLLYLPVHHWYVFSTVTLHYTKLNKNVHEYHHEKWEKEKKKKHYPPTLSVEGS